MGNESATQEPTVSEEYVDLDWQEYEASMSKDFSFVIVISTKDYYEALKRAKDASEKLGYPLDLRGLHPNDEMTSLIILNTFQETIGGTQNTFLLNIQTVLKDSRKDITSLLLPVAKKEIR
jgi:hypothetical protein